MWNYRVIKTSDEVTKEEFYEIGEVYYNNIGKPMGHCLATLGSEKPEDIRVMLQMMLEAVDKPVLTFGKSNK